MSFSSRVKDEVARLKITNNCCIIAELAGLIRMCGTINYRSSDDFSCSFITENAPIARRIFTFLKRYYSEDVEVQVSKNKQLKRNNNYIVSLNDFESTKLLLDELDFIKGENVFTPTYKINRELLESYCCKRAYVRGSFLGGGSISNPEKAYHMEFVTNNLEHAEDLSEIINSFNLNSKIVKRKENFIVYLKEGEQISDLITIVGASSGVLKFEDVRILKEMRNNVNRIVNCETANLSKTINASMRQIENIDLINKMIGIESLPDNLRDIAYLRINNPEASLKEIGESLDPVVGKSGVNHRFKKIEEIANNLRGDVNER